MMNQSSKEHLIRSLGKCDLSLQTVYFFSHLVCRMNKCAPFAQLLFASSSHSFISYQNDRKSEHIFFDFASPTSIHQHLPSLIISFETMVSYLFCTWKICLIYNGLNNTHKWIEHIFGLWKINIFHELIQMLSK